MELDKIVASISKINDNTSLFDIPVLLSKDSEDGFINILLPVLGNIQTIARNEADIDAAVDEALDIFIMVANKFGRGVRVELLSLGWQEKPNSFRFKSTPTKLNMLAKSWAEDVDDFTPKTYETYGKTYKNEVALAI